MKKFKLRQFDLATAVKIQKERSDEPEMYHVALFARVRDSQKPTWQAIDSKVITEQLLKLLFATETPTELFLCTSLLGDKEVLRLYEPNKFHEIQANFKCSICRHFGSETLNVLDNLVVSTERNDMSAPSLLEEAIRIPEHLLNTWLISAD